jgi:serine/threonine protein kinase
VNENKRYSGDRGRRQRPAASVVRCARRLAVGSRGRGELGARGSRDQGERRASVLGVPMGQPVVAPSGYRLGERVGAGGMAEVFRAARLGVLGFERPVAIKRMLPGRSQEEQFIREARILSRLFHPNIVSALGFERDPSGDLFLVLEFVDGVDLNQLLHSGPLPHAVVIFLAGEILSGLDHAHRLPDGGGVLGGDVLGVVHRDLSPHNVLLSWEGAVKVADFGVAKCRRASHASASLGFRGKAAFMSPEQIRCMPLDGRSDLFSVGIMMWEMLTGQPLFRRESSEATIWRVLTGPILRPSTLRAVAPDLEAVVMRLLERDPAERYPSAEVAHEALLACDDASVSGRMEFVRLLAERFPERVLSRRASPPMEMPHRQASSVPREGHAHETPRARTRLRWLRRQLRRWRPMIVVLAMVWVSLAVVPFVVLVAQGDPLRLWWVTPLGDTICLCAWVSTLAAVATACGFQTTAHPQPSASGFRTLDPIP